MKDKKNESSQHVVVYQSSDGKLKLEAQLQNETIFKAENLGIV